MESLFHNNKCFLDKITEENNTLKFIYISRDNKDKIIEKKEEIYNIEVKGVFKYVTVGIFRYEIISKEKSLKNKLEDKNLSSLDFSTCIFLLNENFEGFSDRIFEENINFENSIFASTFNCYRSIFKGGFSSCGAVFLADVNIVDTVFEKRMWTLDTIFKRRVSFYSSVIRDETTFRRCLFFQYVSFENSEFKKDLILQGALFLGATYLNASFRNIDMRNLFFGENFILDMHLSKVSKISFFRDSDITVPTHIYRNSFKNKSSYFVGMLNLKEHNIENRGTANVLKNLALENRDQISALKFNSLEYNKHYKSLKWTKKDISDKFLLLAEREVSNYGESIIKSVTVFILFNFSVFLYTKYVFYTEMLPLNFNSFTKILTPYNIENWTTIPHLIFIIINSFIVYEIVKSFRKFSKKL